jgi:hexokinase
MDLNKMTKEQLIQECRNNEHLAAAVEAKDREINLLIKKHEYELNQKNVEINTLNSEKEAEIERRVQELHAEMKKTIDKLQKEIEALVKIKDRRIEELNKVLYAHGDLLKTLESSINTHLVLNNYIVAEIQK